MGSLYAVNLANDGHSVWALDLWHEHVAAVCANRLRITGPIRERVGTPAAQVDLVGIPLCELVIIPLNRGALQMPRRNAIRTLSDNGLVLSIQNGTGAFESVQEIVGANAF